MMESRRVKGRGDRSEIEAAPVWTARSAAGNENESEERTRGAEKGEGRDIERGKRTGSRGMGLLRTPWTSCVFLLGLHLTCHQRQSALA